MVNNVWEVVPRPQDRSNTLQMAVLGNTKPGLWLRGMLKRKELTTKRPVVARIDTTTLRPGAVTLIPDPSV